MDPFSLLSVGFVAGAVVTAVLFIWWSSEPSDEGDEDAALQKPRRPVIRQPVQRLHRSRHRG